MLYGYAISQFVAYFITAVWVSKLIGYNVCRQFKDLFPILLTSIISAIISYFSPYFMGPESILLLSIQFLVYVIMYLYLSKLFKIKELDMYIAILKEKIR